MGSRLPRALALVVAGVLAVAACSGGGGQTAELGSGAAAPTSAPASATSSTSTAPPSSSGVTAAPATSAPDTADVAKARAALVTVDDLPGADWKAKEQLAKPDPPGFSADCGTFTRKVKDIKDLMDRSPQSRSPRFSTGPGVELGESVVVLPTEADAERLIAVYSDRSMPTCIVAIFREQIDRGDAPGLVVEGDPVVQAVDLASAADDTVSFLITAKVSQNGVTATVYMVLAELRVGRAVGELQYTTVQPPLTNDVRALVKPALRRLNEQFG